MLLPLKFSSPRYVSWARVALAIAVLALGFFYLRLSSAPVFYGLMLLYLAHALFVAVRGKGHLGIVGLLVLFGDTVYFLILASYGTERLITLRA